MVLSYSSIAKPTSNTPNVISIASSSKSTPTPTPAATSSSSNENEQDESPSASASSPAPASASQPQPQERQPIASSSKSTTIQHLILDAGPLLSLTPLRHLAGSFHTTPMVLAELRDPKAREHWERLGLTGVEVTVEHPSSEAMAAVTAFAKKTGDFAVLSTTDLSVAALTWQYEVKVNGIEGIRTEPGQKITKRSPVQVDEKQEEEVQHTENEEGQDENVHGEEAENAQQEEEEVEEITQSIEQVLLDSQQQEQPSSTELPTESTFSTIPAPVPTQDTPQPSTEDTAQEIDDESDGGEWINPSNLTTHRSRDLGLITPSGSGAKPPSVAAMTGDFAVQNILLGLGLGLVGEGGKRISSVKSFVLRCHACFKICKDSSKKFCPSCGNATLLRTTVSIDSRTGKQSIHLKKNFQYHLRGTKYTIPDAKMGKAKGQQKGGSGLILREDQREWNDALKYQNIQKQKEDRRKAKGVLEGWNDPDWLPEIISVGTSGKGRSHASNMPSIGHGRKNPNQARRKR
ncbi:hypothetical protein I302_103324 [Kwoniella bestiolae CBS 10118]|uniref:20S-pre-rRNA D-site endonuclease NOB1 n=1 Tax=Kwoniella bestiolae CBS 10118 TaxID=1296100 RepID=A0A1B9G841_9TREE|nr:RNA-binding protein NOB1 [Kwoniella bestiolae CBS 10118]OCF27189.1 RNA-binding protein NOB1 [Kwoniella bestiolae CBS 10118]